MATETRTTTSTCMTEMVQGTHLFEIRQFSLTTKRLAVGRFIRSGTFDVGGFDWAIQFYPSGSSELSQDYVSVFLALVTESAAEVKAFYSMALVDQTTGLPCPAQRHMNVFDAGASTWGLPRFRKRSELEESAYFRDDSIVIQFAVDVVKEPRVSETVKLPRVLVPPSDMSAQLSKLLEGKEHADVTFDVQGESFSAHRIVLAARSPVFKAALYGPMRDREMRRMAIDDMQPAEFRALLRFMYTDSLPAYLCYPDEVDKRDMVAHLLVAADLYAIGRLKLICESILCSCLNAQTVTTILALADRHQCKNLKDACIAFAAASHETDIKDEHPEEIPSSYFIVNVCKNIGRIFRRH